MTNEELKQRWMGAWVRRTVDDRVGQVDEVTPMGGRIVLHIVWSDRSAGNMNASAVALLSLADVQHVFRGLADARKECSRLRRVIDAGVHALQEYGQ